MKKYVFVKNAEYKLKNKKIKKGERVTSTLWDIS